MDTVLDVSPVTVETRVGVQYAIVPMRAFRAMQEARDLIFRCEGKGVTVIPTVEFAGIRQERSELIRLVYELAATNPTAQAWIDAHPPHTYPHAEMCIEDGL